MSLKRLPRSVLTSSLNFLLALTLAVYLALVVRDFCRTIDRYPYLAADDGLANISYVLGTTGRYGFLSSPLQSPTNTTRHDGFYNYGPWYFFLGAGLVWLFGFSLSLLRSIHFFVILFSAVLGFFFLRKGRDRTAAFLYSLMALWLFDALHWPMVRPDIMVSFFALLFVTLSGLALARGSAALWFGAGLAASCGALSHLIAWSLVPSCAFVFLWSAFLVPAEGETRRVRLRKTLGALASVALGGLGGALMFYGSFGFRFEDHLKLLTSHSSSITALSESLRGTTSFSSVLGEHFRFAFGSFPGSAGILLGILVAVAAVLLLLTPLLPGAERRRAWSVLLPPAVTLLFYGASLGVFPNYHAGYAILTQVMSVWLGASGVLVLLEIVEIRARWLRVVLATSAATALIASSLHLSFQKLYVPCYKAQVADRYAGISEYLREVHSTVPAGSSCWGAVIAGMETPHRVQLVQFLEGMNLAHWIPVEKRPEIVPDYLIWGYSENWQSAEAALAGSRFHLHQFHQYFPEERYQLVGLVHGVPYGAARVYRRLSRSEQAAKQGSDELPFVSVYDPATRTWCRRIGPAIGFDLSPTAAGRFKVGYTGNTRVSVADRTAEASLPAGDYLLRVRVKPGSAPRAVSLLAVTRNQDASETIPETGPSFDLASYFATDGAVHLFHRHAGGAFYLSQFDSDPEARILGAEAFPVAHRPPASLEDGARPLPELAAWSPDGQNGVKASLQGDGLLVEGNAGQFSYQITSPALSIPPGHTVEIHQPATIEKGTVYLGVLDETDNWLVPPNQPGIGCTFESGANRSVKLVFANYHLKKEEAEPSRFKIPRGTFRAQPKALYTDRLLDVAKRPGTTIPGPVTPSPNRP